MQTFQTVLCDPDLLAEEATITVDWKEGTEEMHGFTGEELYKKLGIPGGQIPFFNTSYDPQGLHDPWTDEGRKWLETHGKPLALHWYQIVGVLKMERNAFANRPVLIMDEVGLGKTIQVAAFIAVMTYYREHFTKHGSFPGEFKIKTGKYPVLTTNVAIR